MVSAAIDRWLERRVVVHARRRYPLLEIVPARWICVVARPRVVQVRCSLMRLTAAAAVGAAVAVVPGTLGV